MLDLRATQELCRILSDETRLRLLSVLAAYELSVAELTEITGAAQSRVSTHLAKLREAGLVRVRRAGASSFYGIEPELPNESLSLFQRIRDTMADALLDEDRERARRLVEAREAGTWAESVAGSMERHYSPGRTWESNARGTIGLMRFGDLLDIASGDGVLAELLAPRARSVTCLDLSERVVRAGKERLEQRENVRFVQGDMHALPFDASTFDQILLMNALSYTRSPEAVFAEVARVLRPNGILSGVTLARHEHADRVAAYNHMNLGFEPEAVAALIADAGLRVEACLLAARETRPPHFSIVTFSAAKAGRTS